MLRCKNWVLMTLFFCLGIPYAPITYADPPPWAPAHGWRKKHDPYYTGYSGKKWNRDYGVVRGSCDWGAVGAVIGGVIGGATGAKISKRENRVISVILGTVLGAVIGNEIGKRIEKNDRGCIGHSLELAADNQTIAWQNPNTGLDYQLMPLNGFSKNGKKCRNYQLDITGDGVNESSQQAACQSSPNVWKPI